MKNDDLGNRMKSYEEISRNYLTRRVPVIIRLDGKAFHTFTRGMTKPFDSVLTRAMQGTMRAMCEGVQGCVLGYTQSDEITLVLTDYATATTDAWFEYNVQKMVSVAASMATLAFAKEFDIAHREWAEQAYEASADRADTLKRDSIYSAKRGKAMFDARAFTVPRHEVCNCLIWRQKDAERNSISAVGQANFSHRELQGKTCNEIQEMLWSQKQINWNDLPVEVKRGSCCTKQLRTTQMPDPGCPDQEITVTRRKWVVDREIPIFTKDRDYIETLIQVEVR